MIAISKCEGARDLQEREGISKREQKLAVGTASFDTLMGMKFLNIR